jgi:hypothetical protein
MDVMLENYLRRMERNQEETIKLLKGISAELCLQRGIRSGNLYDEEKYGEKVPE